MSRDFDLKKRELLMSISEPRSVTVLHLFGKSQNRERSDGIRKSQRFLRSLPIRSLPLAVLTPFSEV